MTWAAALALAIAAQPGLGAPSQPAAGAGVAAAAQDYVLGSGDRLRLSLYDDDTFKGEFAIADNGTVSLPLIGTQQAGGLTLSAFRTAIEAKLADGYYRAPRLSAEVVNFRPFYILGEVNKPGQYPYVTGMTLGQAIAIANGYTYGARKGMVGIKRAGASEEIKVPANSGMHLEPGDTIRVLERLF